MVFLLLILLACINSYYKCSNSVLHFLKRKSYPVLVHNKALDYHNMKVSDLFIKCLEDEGVEYIFGLPGEETSDLMISLLDSKIKFILVRHEQGAAFMADVYGRLAQKVGVCLSTLEPVPQT